MGLRRYLLRLAIALDQLVNTGLGGVPDETISSRVGRAALADRPFALELEWIIDRIFELLGAGPNHCRRHIEWDEVPQLKKDIANG